MGFARRARRLALLLPHLALAAAAGVALAAAARGRRRRRGHATGGSTAPGASGECGAADALVCISDAPAGGKSPAQPTDVLSRPAGAAGEPYSLYSAAASFVSAAAGQLWALAPPLPAALPAPLSARQLMQRIRGMWFALPVGGAAAQDGGGEGGAVDPELLRELMGDWSKDFRRCEPMDEFFSLFGVSRVLRKAARLMRGMRIEAAGDAIEVTQVCALRWFSVTERFPLDPSSTREHRRRDMRRGPQRGSMRRGPGGSVRLEVSWGPPLEGCAVDELRLVPPPPGDAAKAPELHVVSTAWVGGQKARFKWVLVRRGGGGGGSGGGAPAEPEPEASEELHAAAA